MRKKYTYKQNPLTLRTELNLSLPQKKAHICVTPPAQDISGAGSWTMQLPHTKDSAGWLVIDWPQTAELIDSRRSEPLLGAPGPQGVSDLSNHCDELRELFQSHYCPPGSIYHCWNEAPLLRLTQHINPTHTEDPKNILIARAGGLNSALGRSDLLKWVPLLRENIKTFSRDAFYKMHGLYQLLHVALQYAENEECKNPFKEAGIAWVGKYLYFHYGRALLNLPQEVVYGRTNISQNESPLHIIDNYSTVTGRASKTTLDKLFFNCLIPSLSNSHTHIKMWNRFSPELLLLKTAGFFESDDVYVNHKTAEDFAVLIDVSGKDSLETFYKNAQLKQVYPELRIEVPKREELIKEAQKDSVVRHNQGKTFEVSLNACDLGYEFEFDPEQGEELHIGEYKKKMQGKISPLTFTLHKSKFGDFYLSTPDELGSVFDPIISAYKTGRLIRTGKGEMIKIPLTKQGTPDKQRLVFYYKKGQPDERLLFKMCSLTPNGTIISDAEKIIRANKSLQNHRQFMKLYNAYKIFLQWLEFPGELLKNGMLSGEMSDVVMDSPADSPIFLSSLEERLNYLFGRARNMSCPVRWSKDIFGAEFNNANMRSPSLSDYDKYAIHRALMELRIRGHSYYLNKTQRAEYIVRRWLPWHTQSFIYKFVTDIPEDGYFHRLKRLPKGNDDVFKNFIRDAVYKYGTPVGTSVY